MSGNEKYVITSELETRSGLDNKSIKAMCGQQDRYIEWDSDRRWLWVNKPCKNMKVSLCDRVGLCNSQVVQFANERNKDD